MVRTLQAFLFDKDGTLFDFAATWSPWAWAFLDHVEAVVPHHLSGVADAIGFDRAEGAFRRDSLFIAGTSSEVAARVLTVAGPTPDLSAVMDELARKTKQMLVPDVQGTLTRLGKVHRLGLVTNDSEARARAHLKTHDITHHFEFIAGFDSGFGAKPAPGQLLGFCADTGISPEATAMIGDSRHDLEAGRAAGMTTIGVLTGIAERDDLADLADVVLDDITGIEGWLATR